MRTMPRMLAALVPVALIAAACGTGTTTTSPSRDLLPAASTVPVQTPTAVPTPSATPLASVEPMAPARVTGTSALTQTDEGTETWTGDRVQVRGVVVETATNASDPRVAGTGTAHISIDGVGGYGWESVELVIENEGGTWEGSCLGAIAQSGSDIACWLNGTGDYAGLTYYYHSTADGSATNDEGVILPLPAPVSE